MVSKLAIFSNILLASVAIAASNPSLGARLAHRHENRQSQPINAIGFSTNAASQQIIYGPYWAGAAWAEGNGTFATVTGTFTVPTASGSDGSAAAIWVGIDGYTCFSAILQTGIELTVESGGVLYQAWWQWYPENPVYFSELIISAGDVIRTTVIALSTTSGIAIIEDLTTGQNVNQTITSPYALCEQNAEWIVEDFTENNSSIPVPFADFGTVVFRDASATANNGTVYTPSGATIVEIEQNNTILTSVTIDESAASGGAVTITYLGASPAAGHGGQG